MPYKIVKYKYGFRLCKLNEPNKCFSNKPMTKKQVIKQQKAIGISEHLKGYGIPNNKKLYDEIKTKVYEDNPKHSLFRSALIQKLYKEAGGTYKDNNSSKMNIPKWFKQDWISLNDWLRDEEVKCGNSNTKEKYNEYPLCRPKAIAEKLTKSEIKKMIKEKNELEEKPLITKKVLNRKDLNIKNTLTGLGNNKFMNQLNKLNIEPSEYLKIARQTAQKAGYNPKLLNFSDNNKKKLVYDNIDFGAVNYNDFIIYKLTNPEIAEKKRENYRKRAFKVMQETNNEYSPASLAYMIIW